MKEPERESSRTAILSAQPQIFVRDLERALGFYRDKLGFGVVFIHGEPAFYAQVMRGAARLNLRVTDLPAFDAAFAAGEPDALAATISVAAIELLHDEFRAYGVEMHQGLRNETWGATTFIVADPDGNLICFAG